MESVTLRPGSAYFFTGTVWFFSFGTLIADLFAGFNPAAALFSIAAAYAGYLVFFRPRIVFSEQQIEIINPFVRYEICWQSVSHVDAKFSFFVQVGNKKIHSFAAVSSGRYSNLRGGGLRPFGGFLRHQVESIEVKGYDIDQDGDSFRAVESPRSDTGAALILASQFRKRAKPNADCRNNVRVDYFGVLVLAALILTATVLR
jgi:hypothetical protein